MRKFINKVTLGAVAVAALTLSACMSSGSNPASSSEEGFATVIVQTKANNVNRLSKPGLGKGAAITLDTLIVTAISNASTPDTVIFKVLADTAGFETATDDHTVPVVLSLKALRNWTISAKTIDINDSVIQEGSVVTGDLFAGQTKVVTLNATPNFTIYTATFNVPDSVRSPTGNFKQRITVTKLQLLLGSTVVDSLVDPAGIDSLTDHTLTYDYVTSSATHVSLKVFGTIEFATDIDPATSTAWNTGSHVLYDSVNVPISSLNAVYPAVNTVALPWRGPVQGVADISVEIEKVGQVAIGGTTNPIVLNKKK